MTGKQFRQFGEKAAEIYVNTAVEASVTATNEAKRAGKEADRAKEEADRSQEHEEGAKEHEKGAERARQAIEDMTVSADTLPSGSEATATKTAAGGSFNLHFGIPRGEQGATGPTGPEGKQGPPGPQGMNGVAVAAEGFYAFNVNDEGNLILSYTGDEASDFSIHKDDGHLWLNIS